MLSRQVVFCWGEKNFCRTCQLMLPCYSVIFSCYQMRQYLSVWTCSYVLSWVGFSWYSVRARNPTDSLFLQNPKCTRLKTGNLEFIPPLKYSTRGFAVCEESTWPTSCIWVCCPSTVTKSKLLRKNAFRRELTYVLGLMQKWWATKDKKKTNFSWVVIFPTKWTFTFVWTDFSLWNGFEWNFQRKHALAFLFYSSKSQVSSDCHWCRLWQISGNGLRCSSAHSHLFPDTVHELAKQTPQAFPWFRCFFWQALNKIFKTLLKSAALRKQQTKQKILSLESTAKWQIGEVFFCD